MPRSSRTVDAMPAPVADADVVIVGGGYAGLAAALPLGPRALIIEQHPIGAIQRSACAMPLACAKHFEVTESVVQVYSEGFVHTAHGTSRHPLPHPFCLFDHATLCQCLLERGGAHVLRARVQGLAVDGRTVLTSAGPVRGQVLIDASGWPAILATARRPALAAAGSLTVGLEAEVVGQAEGIHFFFDPALVQRGYAWVFPAGETLRVGICAFDGRRGDLRPGLAWLLTRLGLSGAPSRGGRMPWGDRPAVVDDILVCGDAAGHCLPLTAEGIRFALHFGEAAGRAARQIIDGDDPATARAAYAARVQRHHRRAAILRRLQPLVGPLGNRTVALAAGALAWPPLRGRIAARYVGWTEA